MQVVPGFANNFRPKSLDLSEQMLTNLYDTPHTALRRDKLLELSQETYAKLKISQEEAAKIEKETCDQHSSTKWSLLHAGQITASVMKDACRTNQENPAKSLIKKICYKNKFRSIATDWGCMHEDEAQAAYVDVFSEEHQNFSVKTSGLIINPCWPYIGASPDSIVECSCCGMRCLEIKSTFIQK